MIDYQKLFKEKFDPVRSLFDEIEKNIDKTKNPIYLNEKLNHYSRNDVLKYIQNSDNDDYDEQQPSTNVDNYSKFHCSFTIEYDNNSKENLKDKIINSTFKNLESQGLLDVILNYGVTFIGIYLFISKNGCIVCYVNTDLFSPEKFLDGLKEKGISENIQLDESIQSFTDKFAKKFSEHEVDVVENFNQYFNAEYSKSSTYCRFKVLSDKTDQVVDSVIKDESLNFLLKHPLDKMGVSLFYVYDQIQVLLVVFQDLSKLNEMGDKNLGDTLFDENDGDDELPSNQPLQVQQLTLNVAGGAPVMKMADFSDISDSDDDNNDEPQIPAPQNNTNKNLLDLNSVNSSTQSYNYSDNSGNTSAQKLKASDLIVNLGSVSNNDNIANFGDDDDDDDDDGNYF